jgi:hypothetical protein
MKVYEIFFLGGGGGWAVPDTFRNTDLDDFLLQMVDAYCTYSTDDRF